MFWLVRGCKGQVGRPRKGHSRQQQEVAWALGLSPRALRPHMLPGAGGAGQLCGISLLRRALRTVGPGGDGRSVWTQLQARSLAWGAVRQQTFGGSLSERPPRGCLMLSGGKLGTAPRAWMVSLHHPQHLQAGGCLQQALGEPLSEPPGSGRPQ